MKFTACHSKLLYSNPVAEKGVQPALSYPAFLPAGKSNSVFSDAGHVLSNPVQLIKKIIAVNNSKTISIKLSNGGGNVIILHKN